MTLWLAGLVPSYHGGASRRLYLWWALGSLAWLGLLLFAFRTREVTWATGLGFGVTVPAIGALFALDLVDQRLPRRISYTTLAILFPFIAASEFLGPIFGAIAMISTVGIFALLAQGSLGYGDLHLAPLLGVIIGWFDPRQVLMAATVSAISGGAVASWLLITRRRRRTSLVPFGPFLLLGVAVAIMGVS
jgi:leader peptidase (prepilin peptidase) / N-methyltransferase